MPIQFVTLPVEYQQCSCVICSYLKLDCTDMEIPVTVLKSGNGIQLFRKQDGWVLQCSTVTSFARGLGLLAQFRQEAVGFHYRETPRLSSLGVLLDCSRNAAPTVAAIKDMLLNLAVMGYNTAQLYMEDIFELEGYPYFGYMRGRYSKAELQEIDAFAAKIGIEMVPCIQTLAHLPRAFHWCELDEIVDCNDILLCGDPKTYAFIEAMFRTMRECFKSNQINIGMDEAHMLGLGKYLDQNGYRNRFDIMLEHLQRVVEIARKYNYRPMMWSDMFFRLANNGSYYSTDNNITKAICEKVPEDVSLIYWDYYHEDSAIYEAMLQAHRGFDRRVIFAAGAWKWVGFTPQNAFSMRIAQPAAQACFNNNVTDVVVTCWADNGAEASIFSVLPTLSYWAELCWASTQSNWLDQRFEACCGIAYQDFMLMDQPNLTPDHPEPKMGVNPSKYLFYQDLLHGLADSCSPDDTFAKHFGACAEALEMAEHRTTDKKEMFAAQAALCRVLELKSNLGCNLRNAYLAKDRETLQRLAEETIPELLSRLKVFQHAYHRQWLAENKPFGLEVFDIRTGGLYRRIEVAMERIQAYLSGEISSIDELEQPLLPFAPSKHRNNPFQCVLWEKVATPSSLVWM